MYISSSNSSFFTFMLLLVNNTWLHTDVTNDDLGSDVNNRYFLVNTDTIKFDGRHSFSNDVYSEFQR